MIHFGMEKGNARPALVANRLIESSLSPCARTWPHNAKVVVVDSALPSESTSTTESWTDAWSFEVIRRSMGTDVRNRLEREKRLRTETNWSPRICEGRKGQQGFPINIMHVSS